MERKYKYVIAKKKTENRYLKGRDLTLLELIEVLRRRKYVYLRDTPKHPAVIEQMRFKTICGFVEHRMFYRAIDTNPNNQKEK